MRQYSVLFAILAVLVCGTVSAVAEETHVSVNSSVDFYSRYVWRGLDIAGTPSIQPSVSVEYEGLEFGIWGAYAASADANASDEIDFWLDYSRSMESGVSYTLIATDYYFPNAGIDFFNFNNYDAVKDDTIPNPGAHILEIGLSVTGPASAPITLSAYINVYNDAGNNTYFQADYPVTVGETDLSFFCGFAGGSKDNPDYYGTDGFAAINVGATAVHPVVKSGDFSLPLTVSFIVNPKAKISHLVAGLSF